MNEQNAEFERSLADQIVREVANQLGYHDIQFLEHDEPKPSPPYITTLYGQKLVLPKNLSQLEMIVTTWFGMVNADWCLYESDQPMSKVNTIERTYDIADPLFIDKMVALCKQLLSVKDSECLIFKTSYPPA